MSFIPIEQKPSNTQQSSLTPFFPCHNKMDELRKRIYEYLTNQDTTLRLDQKNIKISLTSIQGFPDVFERINAFFNEKRVLREKKMGEEIPPIRVEFTFAELFNYIFTKTKNTIQIKGGDAFSILGPHYLTALILELAGKTLKSTPQMQDWVSDSFYSSICTRRPDTDIQLEGVEDPKEIIECILDFFAEHVDLTLFVGEYYVEELKKTGKTKYQKLTKDYEDSELHEIVRGAIQEFALTKLYYGDDFSIFAFTDASNDRRDYDIVIPKIELKRENLFVRDSLKICLHTNQTSYFTSLETNEDTLYQVILDRNAHLIYSRLKKIQTGQTDWSSWIFLGAKHVLIENSVEKSLFINAMLDKGEYLKRKEKKRKFTKKETSIDLRDIKFIYHILKHHWKLHQTNESAFAYFFRGCHSASINSKVSDEDLLCLWKWAQEKKLITQNQDNLFYVALQDAIFNYKIPFRKIVTWLKTLLFICCPKSLSKNDGIPQYLFESIWLTFTTIEDLQKTADEIFPFISKNNSCAKGYLQIFDAVLKLDSFSFPSPWIPNDLPHLNIDLLKMRKTALEWIQNPNSFINELGMHLFLSVPFCKVADQDVYFLFFYLIKLKGQNLKPDLAIKIEKALKCSILEDLLGEVQKFSLSHNKTLFNSLDHRSILWIEWLLKKRLPCCDLAAQELFCAVQTGKKWEKKFGLKIFSRLCEIDFKFALSFFENLENKQILVIEDYCHFLENGYFFKKIEKEFFSEEKYIVALEKIINKIIEAQELPLTFLEFEKNTLSNALEWFSITILEHSKFLEKKGDFLCKISLCKLLKPNHRASIWIFFLDSLLKKKHLNLSFLYFREASKKDYFQLVDHRLEQRLNKIKIALIQGIEKNEKEKVKLFDPKFVKELVTGSSQEKNHPSPVDAELISVIHKHLISSSITSEPLTLLEKLFEMNFINEKNRLLLFTTLLERVKVSSTADIIPYLDPFFIKVKTHACKFESGKTSPLFDYLEATFEPKAFSTRQHFWPLLSAVLDWDECTYEDNRFIKGRDFIVHFCISCKNKSLNISIPEFLKVFLKKSQNPIFDSFLIKKQYRKIIDFFFFLEQYSLSNIEINKYLKSTCEGLFDELLFSDLKPLLHLLFQYYEHNDESLKMIEKFKSKFHQLGNPSETNRALIKFFSNSKEQTYLEKACQLILELDEKIFSEDLTEYFEKLLYHWSEIGIQEERSIDALVFKLIRKLQPLNSFAKVIPALIKCLSEESLALAQELSTCMLEKNGEKEPLVKVLLSLVDNLVQKKGGYDFHAPWIECVGTFLEKYEIKTSSCPNEAYTYLDDAFYLHKENEKEPSEKWNKVETKPLAVLLCEKIISELVFNGLIKNEKVIEYSFFFEMEFSYETKLHQEMLNCVLAPFEKLLNFPTPFRLYKAALLLAKANKYATATNKEKLSDYYEKLMIACEKFPLHLIEERPLSSYILFAMTSEKNVHMDTKMTKIYTKYLDFNIKILSSIAEKIKNETQEYRSLIECISTKGTETSELHKTCEELFGNMKQLQKYQISYLETTEGMFKYLSKNHYLESLKWLKQLMPHFSYQVLFAQDCGLSLSFLRILAFKPENVPNKETISIFAGWLEHLFKEYLPSNKEILALLEYTETMCKHAIKMGIMTKEAAVLIQTQLKKDYLK